MADSLEDLVNSMQNMNYSSIGEKLTTDDAMKILQALGNFIKKNQQSGYSVYLKDFGLFTMFQESLPISHHPIKFAITQKPVFQLSHRLASKFRIKWSRQIAEPSLPQRLINPSTIAMECQLDRAKVIFCLNELATFIEKSLSENKSAQIPVYGIGTLRVNEDGWKMRFCKEYLRAVSMNNALHVVADQ